MNKCKHDWQTVEVYKSMYEPSLTSGQRICRKCNLREFFTRETEKAEIIDIKNPQDKQT